MRQAGGNAAMVSDGRRFSGVFGDGGHPSSAAVQAGLASCDVVCVRGDPAAFAPLVAGKGVLDASRATLAALQGVSVSDPR